MLLCIKIDSVISNSRRSGGKPVAVRASSALELRGRQIDCNLDVRRPVHGVGACFARDPFSERVDQTGYFGQWNETIGGIKPRCGWHQ